MRSIVVHGGCGDEYLSEEEKRIRIEGVREAAAAGMKKLQETDSAMDAVEAAIHVLEDNPHFDAGTGSFYNLCGEIEMDALLMDSQGRAGGVACIQRVQYPISVARKVLEETPHVLIVGEGAELFARTYGFPVFNPDSELAQQYLAEQIEKLPEELAGLMQRYKEIRAQQREFSTVGAVAVDGLGRVVAGTSTGGIPQKLPGRVGDSAIIGAGTYASTAGGASATGEGEGIIRLGLTRYILDRMAAGTAGEEACREIIARASEQNVTCGVIVLDQRGKMNTAHNGRFMPVGCWNEAENLVKAWQ